ncbi:MAG: hypothetical protein AB7S38_35260 [Vulcanimicrobiota bacterium]
MPEIDALNTYLQEFAQGGEFESVGRFTISSEAADEKLRKFQLLDPGLYVVQMVAAAVAGQATFLEVKSSLTRCEFLYDGEAATAEQLEHLSGFLYDTTGMPRHLTELAVGLHAAQAIEPKQIIVESYRLDQANRLTWRGSQQKIESLEPRTGLSLNRVVVDKGFGLTSRVIKVHPELANLMRVCRHAPLQLKVDGDLLNEPIQLPSPCMGVKIYPSLDPRAKVSALPDGRFPSAPAGPAPVAAVLALGGTSRGLAFIHQGILFRRPHKLLGLNCLTGLVVAPELKKNLSHSDLVENDTYTAVVDQLKAWAVDLLVEVCRNPDALAGSDREYLVADVQAVLAQPPEQLAAENLGVLEHWLAHHGLATGRQKDLDSNLALADHLDSMGLSGRARHLRLTIRSSMVTGIKTHLEKLEFERARGACQPLHGLLDKLELPEAELELNELELILASLEAPHKLARPGFEELLGRPMQPRARLWVLHRAALVDRARGDLASARQRHGSALSASLQENRLKAWGHRFEAEMLRVEGDDARAYEQLCSALEAQPDDRDLLEELAFAARFSGPAGQARERALGYLLQAIPLPERDEFVHWRFLEWLLQEGKGGLPLDEWARYRARASFAQLKALLDTSRDAIEELLEPNLDLMGYESLVQAQLNKVEAAMVSERQFGPVSVYTQFVRRRAVYQLYRLEDRHLASTLVVRGHLLGQAFHLLSRIDQAGHDS